MKRLLILGATVNQLPFVVQAKKKGIFTTTLDNVPKNIAHKYSDHSVNISTVEKDQILNYAISNNINGVVTCASDLALPSAAYVCEKMNLPSAGYKAVLTTVNKEMFRIFQKNHHIRSPRYFTFTREDETINAINSLEGKWVIKPVDSSGSKGVSLIHANKNLSSVKKIKNAFNFSSTKNIILEEYIEGINCSVDGFIENGIIKQLYITNKDLTPFPNLTPISHSIPTQFSNVVQEKILQSISDILHLLKVSTSPFDFDILVTNKELIYIIEMSLRIGGNGIPNLIACYSNYNLYDSVISHALSEPINYKTKISHSNYWGIFLIRANKSGILSSISDPKLLYDKYNKYLTNVVYDSNIGDYVNKFTQGNHRVGHIIVKAKSHEELKYVANSILTDINILIDTQ